MRVSEREREGEKERERESMFALFTEKCSVYHFQMNNYVQAFYHGSFSLFLNSDHASRFEKNERVHFLPHTSSLNRKSKGGRDSLVEPVVF